MKYTLSAMALVASLTAMAASANTVVELDFGDTTQSSFGTDGNLIMSFDNVADGLNATLSVDSAFNAKSSSVNGSVSGDIRVSQDASAPVTYSLELWDNTIGSGYEALADLTDAEWTLGFFDIDAAGGGTSWSVVTFEKPVTYTVTAASQLVVSETDDTISFSGENYILVDGTTGLEAPLTEEQAGSSVLVTLTGANSFSFSHTATEGDPTKWLVIDGGSLTYALDAYDPVTSTAAPAPVPLPAAGLLLLGGIATLGGASRLRKARAA